MKRVSGVSVAFCTLRVKFTILICLRDAKQSGTQREKQDVLRVYL